MTHARRMRVLALLVGVALAAPARAGVFDYLYVEPDVGGSAGGHVALRLDDSVYHFQNTDGGMLRLTRESWERFRWQYSVRQNRSLRVARIRASDDTRARLRTAFDGRWLAGRRVFAERAALEDEVRYFAALRRSGAAAGDATAVRLRAAGYFFAGPDDPPGLPSASLVRLRDRVVRQFGPSFLAERIAALEAELTHLDPADHARAPAEPLADGPPSSGRGAVAHRTDATLELLALRVLDAARSLRPDAVRSDAQAWALTATERIALSSYGRSLEADLLRLLVSPRTDRGRPLLVALARLAAIGTSIETGRLVVLDTYPSDAAVVSGADVLRRGPLAAELVARGRLGLAAARARFVEASSPGEGELQALEEAANRDDEIRRALRDGTDLRLSDDAFVPARLPAAAMRLPAPAYDLDAVARAEGEVTAELHEYDDRLRAAFGYHLTRRNCVSELFATIDATFGIAGSRERLGGHVTSDSALGWIPAVSFEQVLAAYDVAGEGVVSSYRRAFVAERAERDHSAFAELREASTLTSSIYRGSDRDSRFLFFTDGALLPRPLFGAFNVVAGLGETTLGILEAPFDRGRTLWSGVKGVVFSLPELAFVNLRKGTFEVAPDEVPRTQLVLSERRPVR